MLTRTLLLHTLEPMLHDFRNTGESALHVLDTEVSGLMVNAKSIEPVSSPYEKPCKSTNGFVVTAGAAGAAGAVTVMVLPEMFAVAIG